MFLMTPPKNAMRLLDSLTDAGHEAFLVGGCIRDTLLGLSPHDWDIACSADPEAVKAALPHCRILETGIKHGTLTVLLDKPYEITTFRAQEGTPDRLFQDLSFRDFTFNAMAYHPKTGLIDPFGGEKDIRSKVIRCVGCAESRFREDPLRILRAVRFQSKLGFSLTQETQDALSCVSLHAVAAERIGCELRALLAGKYAADALTKTPGPVLAAVPELSSLASSAKALSLASEDEVVRLAAFFHPLPAQTVQKIMRRLAFSRELTDCTVQLIAHAEAPLIPADALRWLTKMPVQQLRRLAALRFALTGQPQNFFLNALEQALHSGCAYSLKTLAIGGSDLVALGAKPGPQIGLILSELLDAVVSGTLQNEPDVLKKEAARRLSSCHYFQEQQKTR